jgi:hypothetical protein
MAGPGQSGPEGLPGVPGAHSLGTVQEAAIGGTPRRGAGGPPQLPDVVAFTTNPLYLPAPTFSILERSRRVVAL